MKSILEELYAGNIRPDSRIYEKDSPFVKVAHVKKESLDKLMETMNEIQKELFETYTDAQGEIEGITRYDTFIYSFILGSSLMMEILVGREEMLK